MNLPSSSRLPISALAASFDQVTNSYKFYWFLAILEQLREGNGPVLSLNQLLASMVASVWYPTNYFRLSFGKQDQLGNVVIRLGQESGIAVRLPWSTDQPGRILSDPSLAVQKLEQ